MTEALLVEGVRVHYGETVALDDVDLAIESGDVIAVLGPSGSGKSTLLRAVAGLEPLTAGRISAGGRDLSGVPTHQRQLGLMFQDHALFPHESVAGNIGYGLRMAGAAADVQQARVAEMLSLVGLDGYGPRPVSALSGGEAQRVALARSLAPSPALLMLDEPLGSLDRVLREQLALDLRSMLGDVGISALHVTHDQTEAFTVADRVVIMCDGRIEQSGRPEQLWHEPANRFVAEFLGHPNIWELGGETVLVPITAIGLDASGELEVIVDDVVFADGRFRVTATAPDRRVVFETPQRLMPGDTAQLSINAKGVRPLPHRGTL